MKSVEHSSITGSVSAAEFRAIAALFPSGVTVITRRLDDGRPYGMTVSSFTTVSLDPPLILVCVDRTARFAEQLGVGLPFLVNVLSEEQESIAKRFANRQEEDRFGGIVWGTGWSDLPLLAGSVATFGCTMTQIIEGGDHLVVLGAVGHLQRHAGRALVWCERGYHCLPRPSGIES